MVSYLPHLFWTEKQQIEKTRISGALEVRRAFWSLQDNSLKDGMSLAHLCIISNCNFCNFYFLILVSTFRLHKTCIVENKNV